MTLHVGTTPWLDEHDGHALHLVAQARFAERIGLQSMFVAESHFAGPASAPSPLLRLAAVAAATDRLLLGTTSFLLTIRPALVAAEEAAVLDRLSGGRLVLGLGRGFRAEMFEAFGESVAGKRERFEEALEAMRRAWRGEPLASPAADGRPVVLAPLPVQRPHPPIWVAAFGPKALEQAGRLDLPYLASPIEPHDVLRHNYALHAAARTTSEPLAVPIMRSAFTSRSANALAAARAGLEHQARTLRRATAATLSRSADRPLEEWALVGEPEAIADQVAWYRERYGMSHLILRPAIAGVEPHVVEGSLELLARALVG